MNTNAYNINSNFIINEIEENDVKNCKYYTIDLFKEQVLNEQTVNRLSVINFNIRSLCKNRENFLYIISTKFRS